MFWERKRGSYPTTAAKNSSTKSIASLFSWVAGIGQWNWRHGRNRRVLVMAPSGRIQMKIVFGPVLPRMSLVCGSMLMVLGLVSLLIGPVLDVDHFHRLSEPRPHSLPAVRINQLTETLQSLRAVQNAFMDVPALVGISPGNIWTSKVAKFYYGCSSPTKSYPRRISELESNGYILIQTSGGLNQQRIGIMDAVVVARILNATLVVPELDHTSFWEDSSNFSDIFDVDWFIAALASDVVIVKELPRWLKVLERRLMSMRVPRKSTPEYYRRRVLPILKRKKAIRFTKFDYRLANNLDEDLQKLRCRVNYHALRFTTDIRDMGDTLVGRLRQRSGRYIALHLRFEPDMLAFSGCYYGGGEKELRELGSIRNRWETLHPRNPERQLRNGKCPLTPQDVGLMLRALGFGNNSHLYVASGEVYGGEQNLAPLKALFPNFYTKNLLANNNELQPFSSYSSRMAAIDYIVCGKSDAFITNNNGNMARILAGHRLPWLHEPRRKHQRSLVKAVMSIRRYFGHKLTVRPNAKRLGPIFLSRPNMTWSLFSSKVRKVQKGFMGEPDEIKPGRGEFSEYPGSCICKNLIMDDELQVLKKQQTSTTGKKEKDSVNEIAELQVQNEQDDERNLKYSTTGSGTLQEENFQVQHTDVEKMDNSSAWIEDLELEDMPWLSD